MCGDGSEANVEVPKPVQALQQWPGLHVGCGAGHSLALCRLPSLPLQGSNSKDIGPSLGATADTKPPEAVTAEKETGKKDNWEFYENLPGVDANGL